MKRVKVSEGQTLEDLAIQEYGAEEAVIFILQDNGLGLDSTMYAGRELFIRDEVPEINADNRAIVKYFKDNNLKLNSGVVEELEGGLYVEDDYWDDGYVE